VASGVRGYVDPTTQSLIIQRYTAGIVPRLISAETGYSKTQTYT